MTNDSFFKSVEVCSSGLKAMQARMDTIAQNIANAHVTRGEGGDPYRRQAVVFETIMDKNDASGGVRVKEVVSDSSPFTEVYNPGHPDADEEGILRMPNVKVPLEMVDMISAVRAYEANLNLIKTFKAMFERALNMGR